MGLFTKSPGDYNPEPKPYNADRPLRASAQVIKLDTRTEIESFSRNTAKSRSTDSWQSAAWDYYDEVGEVKYSFGVTASTVSRIRIYPGVVVDPARPPQHVNDTEELPEGLAEAAMRGMKLLASGPGGIPTLMSALALNLQVAGECYLVQIPERAGAGIPETWAIYSTDSIVVDQNGTVAIRARKEDRIQDYIVLPKTAFVARIWKAHPRFPGDPDSSMRGLLGPLEELMLLNRTLRATARSRLNAGMLYLPDGLSLARGEATPFTDDGDPTTAPDGLPGGTNDDEDEFEVELMEAMTTPIQDEDSASAVVPLIVRGPAELGEKIKIFSFARSFDAALTAEREATLDRVLSGLDIPKEMVKGLAEIKYCLSEDTEILTRRGWLSYTELTTDDEALTLDHRTGLSAWQPVLAINTFDVIDEPMLRIEQRGHSSLSTMDHRWPVIKQGLRVSGDRRRVVTSRELTTSDRVPTAAPLADLPTQAKHSDAFVELVAWFWTEGSVHNRDKDQRRRWAQITQSDRVNSANVLSIRRALTELYGPAQAIDRNDPRPKRFPAWTESVDEHQQVRFMLNHEASEELLEVVEGRDKIVRTDFVHTLTKAQLDLFIEKSVAADGHTYASGGQILHQKVEARLDAFELACILSGRAVRRYSHTNGYAIRILTNRVFQPVRSADPEVVPYTGVVWCPTTANGTWLARRNGTVFYTGNSNAVVIDDQYFRSNVEPLTLGMVDALTTVFMRQYLLAMGFSRSDAERVVIWYDPADVVVRPNRNEDATQGYDRYILSEEAWRRTHGFSEADAPSKDEVVQRLVISKGQLPDALTEALLQVMAPEIMQAARAGNPQAAENIPPEVAQALGQPPSQAPAEPAAPEPTPFEDQSPTPPPGAPAPPTSRPRNPDEPITAPPRPAA